jgi:nicotinate phosphoribosyltransferase
MGKGSPALLTDLYEITMAYAYWKEGLAGRKAAFHLFFRKNPFAGGYAVACGLETALDFVSEFRFAPDDLEYLATLKGDDGRRLLGGDFLEALGSLALDVDIDAVPEGTVVFPHEPVLRVTGPIPAAQLLESALINILNFQSLVATKTARVCAAARGDPVLEFGLRRGGDLEHLGREAPGHPSRRDARPQLGPGVRQRA